MLKKIIDVSATWCGPCKAFKPPFEEVSKDKEFAKYLFSSVDVDTEEGETISDVYGIRNVPTILFIDENNKEISRATGNLSKKEFCKKIIEISDE